MHTVCETREFQTSAADAGMTRDEIDALIRIVSADPMVGDVMQGTGGCRKVRMAGRGKGKSGGYRIITFFTGDTLPVFSHHGFRQGRTSQSHEGRAERPRETDESACRNLRQQGHQGWSGHMTRKAFDKIAAGLDEAIAVARGDLEPARLHVPAELDLKIIRAKTKLSQNDFAHRFGFTADQIKAWEQGRSRPLGGVRPIS